MQELTRPIHFRGVFEEHMEATGQRQQSASSPNWDLTQELSRQVPVQLHSRTEPAGTARWAGCNARVTGTHWVQKKKSWEQR